MIFYIEVYGLRSKEVILIETYPSTVNRYL